MLARNNAIIRVKMGVVFIVGVVIKNINFHAKTLIHLFKMKENAVAISFEALITNTRFTRRWKEKENATLPVWSWYKANGRIVYEKTITKNNFQDKVFRVFHLTLKQAKKRWQHEHLKSKRCSANSRTKTQESSV